MIKLFTLLTQLCCAIAAVLTFIAHHYLLQGGLFALIAIVAATVFMALPHVVDHYFIEEMPEQEDELSFIKLKMHPDVEECVNQPVIDY